VLTLAILADMERQIKEATGIDRLGDYFDYIAGTSTGSIIAAGLVVGMSANDLLDFYGKFGRAMFEKTALLEQITSLFSSLYEDEPLARKLKEIFHDGDGKPADLTAKRLKCLLLVVTRNMQMDAVEQIPNLKRIGEAVAKRALDVKKHFSPFLSVK
jgi:uncharacterized protein